MQTPIYPPIPFTIVISQKNPEKSHLNPVKTNPTNQYTKNKQKHTKYIHHHISTNYPT